MPCRSLWEEGVSQHVLQVSRPTPKGEVEGSGWGVSMPTPQGEVEGSGQGHLQVHTRGVSRSTPGGISRPTPGVYPSMH